MWWFVLTAGAGVPAGLLPALAPWDAPEQYAAHAEASGLDDALVCEPVLPGEARLCLKVQEEKRRRWVTTADLDRWGAAPRALFDHLRAEARKHPLEIERVGIEDMDSHYARLRDGDGWAAVAVLAPERLAEALGGAPILLGVPVDGVAMAWKPGAEEVDRVMLIGVREVYAGMPGGITPAVYAWSDRGFTLFGRAEPKP